jgi:hypothetical protein
VPFLKAKLLGIKPFLKTIYKPFKNLKMGTLLRGISERFNPQIHTEDKSLTVNMAKHMEIKNKSFDLFATKNKFISWLYATGRVNMGAQNGKVMKASNSIHDNAFRIAYKGSLFIPAYSWGKATFSTSKAELASIIDMTASGAGVTYGTGVAVAADISHNVLCAISVMHDPANNIFGDKYNEGDVIALGNYLGTSIIVAGDIGPDGGSKKAASGDHYVVYGKVSSKSGLFDADHLAAGELLSEAGNRFGEGSERGFQRERRTKWRINYSFISRATLTITGSALNQKVAIIYNDETKATMWELEAVMDLREKHAIDMEMGARHSRMSMDPSSHSWYENYGTNLLTLEGFTSSMGIVAPVVGDGWIPQLEDSFTIGYDPNNDLDIAVIELFITILAQRAPNGSTGNTFVILGDKLAHIKIDKALKLLIGFSQPGVTSTNNTRMVFNERTGTSNKVGFTIDKYTYLENDIIFIEDELSNHPAFAPQNGGIIGTGTMYVLNASMVNGVSNIDLLARNDRELRAKYIDGMHSLDASRNNSSVAFSGFDGGRFDLLSEVLPIIYSTESCGIIKATAKFAGGALQAEAVASEKAAVWHY